MKPKVEMAWSGLGCPPNIGMDPYLRGSSIYGWDEKAFMEPLFIANETLIELGAGSVCFPWETRFS